LAQQFKVVFLARWQKLCLPVGLCVCVCVWTVSSQPAKYTAGCSNSYFQPIACITKFSNSHTHTNTHTRKQ